MKIRKQSVVLILVVLSAAIAGWIVFAFFSPPKSVYPPQNPDCVEKTEERVVRGDSLSGLIEAGQTVKVLYGFYNCHPVERENLVIYDYAGNKEPLIKIVKAIEGDKFRLEKTADDCWNVLINDEIAKNSQNIPYCFDETGYRMLSLYEQNYQGAIPPGACLLLGNAPGGTLDSSRFGLIDKSDVLGKAELSESN